MSRPLLDGRFLLRGPPLFYLLRNAGATFGRHVPFLLDLQYTSLSLGLPTATRGRPNIAVTVGQSAASILFTEE
jgi:hypothetical protein